MAKTNSKKIDAALLEQQRLSSLINSMTDGVVALDNKLKIASYNGAALNILDVNGSIDGKSIVRILKPYDKNNQPIDVLKLIREATTATSNRDYWLQYADGSKVALFLSVSPVHTGYTKNDIPDGYVLLLRDITREKSLEEERNEFISVVSHELRTPITITEGNISNALIVAEKNTDPALVVRALKTAHDQVVFLADMINDLSTLSRAERGKLTLELEKINMHELLHELHDSYKKSATEKGLKLHLETDPRLETLNSSKLYVKEVLQNLITNAIKYTEKGSVTVRAHQLDNGTQISVSDTGIGINKSDREKVFDKFFRSEDYRTRQNSGTGLGLYVTLKLIRLLHAEIDVQSEINKGSTFTVFFPNL